MNEGLVRNSIEKVGEAWKVILANNHPYRPSAGDPDKCECGIELVHRVHTQITGRGGEK